MVRRNLLEKIVIGFGVIGTIIAATVIFIFMMIFLVCGLICQQIGFLFSKRGRFILRQEYKVFKINFLEDEKYVVCANCGKIEFDKSQMGYRVRCGNPDCDCVIVDNY